MPRILIVRHGNTFAPGEEPRRIGAATDVPLVESGIAQAYALAAYLADRFGPFERILASPLRRTWETARILAERLGVPDVQPVEWLREIDHGPDENRSEVQVVGRIGADALRAWDTHGTAPPGWNVDALARIAAWRAFFAQVTADTILVTSNGAARFALLGRADLGDTLSGLKLRTGAYGELRLVPPSTLQFVTWDARPPALTS